MRIDFGRRCYVLMKKEYRLQRRGLLPRRPEHYQESSGRFAYIG